MSLDGVEQSLIEVRLAADDLAGYVFESRTYIGEAYEDLLGMGSGLENLHFNSAVRLLATVSEKLGDQIELLEQLDVHVRRLMESLGIKPLSLSVSKAAIHEATKPPVMPEKIETSEYPSFSPYMQQMKQVDQMLSRGIDPKTIPGYVAEGANMYVFDTGDGKVLKMLRISLDDEEMPPPPFNAGFLAPLNRGKGEDRLEQIVTFTEQEGSVVCEKAPGKTLEKFSEEELLAIPDRHYEGLLSILRTMEARALVPDTAYDNFLYDPEVGFTVIDYLTREEMSKRRGYIIEGRTEDMAVAFSLVVGELLQKSSDQLGRQLGGIFIRNFGPQIVEKMRKSWTRINRTLPDISE